MVEKKKDLVNSNIKYSVKNLFKKEEIYNTTDESKEKFRRNITIDNENKHGRRIIELQKEYRNGKIAEKDISNDDIKKLNELYREQIMRISRKIENDQNKIEMYKNEIIEIRKRMYN